MPQPFLRVFGRIGADGSYHPIPGWETTHLVRRCRPAADLSLHLLDARGATIARGGVERRSSLCGLGELHNGDADRITGHVVLHPRATTLEVICNGQVIHTTPIHSEKPTIRSLRVISEDEVWHVLWEAEHSSPLTFNLIFVDPLRRAIPISRHLTETVFDIDIRRLPGGGECRIGLLATDGVRSEIARSDPLQLPARPPEMCFCAPLPEAVISPDQPFSLQGSAHDLAGRALPDAGIVWSIDGTVVSRGVRLAASPPLAPGNHEIEMGYLAEGGGAMTTLKRNVCVHPRTAEMEDWLRARASLST